ncbi:transposon Ty3-G Gag-Pol polyprotein [Trichonephila clavipes]|nr:transposon Ty3-G Gag-Pol polyprotein [Trichonephila clavipes]
MATTALPRNSRRLFIRDRRTNVTFLIDTGSDVSIIPATKTQRQNNSQMTLSAANTSPIHVYTTQTLSLDLGLRRIFQWTFLVGNVSTPIIGADFLYNFRLVPDIIHYIETNSRPVTAKARRLAPDRLRIAKAEFENMITLGHMRPSKIGDPWKKRTWHLSDSRAYRQYEAEDKRLFRDAIQLAIIDAKRQLPSFSYEHNGRRDSVGSLVDWSMITSKNPVFHIRLCGCRLVGLREKPRKFEE